MQLWNSEWFIIVLKFRHFFKYRNQNVHDIYFEFCEELWFKCVTCTNRESNAARLEHAEELLPVIRQSAETPFEVGILVEQFYLYHINQYNISMDTVVIIIQTPHKLWIMCQSFSQLLSDQVIFGSNSWCGVNVVCQCCLSLCQTRLKTLVNLLLIYWYLILCPSNWHFLGCQRNEQ